MYPLLHGSGWFVYIPRLPTGRPCPLGGPGRTGATRVYPPLCGSGWILYIPGFCTGRPYPLSGQGRARRDSSVSAAV